MTTADGYRVDQVAVDLLLVASVPLLLAAVHYLVPGAVRSAYVLHPDSYTPLTLFTAAFLHASDAHLWGNVLGYAVGVLSAYLLCLVLEEHRWFRLTTVALVLGLPVLVNWASVQVLTLSFGPLSAPSLGFSGVTAGFGGFALAALLAYVGHRTDRGTALLAGLAVLLVLLFEVLLVYAPGVPPVATGLVVLALGLCGLDVGRRRFQDGLPTTRVQWVRIGQGLLVFAWTLAVLAYLVVGLFPARIVVDGHLTDVYAHALGFGFGFLVSGWGYRYWRTTYPI